MQPHTWRLQPHACRLPLASEAAAPLAPCKLRAWQAGALDRKADLNSVADLRVQQLHTSEGLVTALRLTAGLAHGAVEARVGAAVGAQLSRLGAEGEQAARRGGA